MNPEKESAVDQLHEIGQEIIKTQTNDAKGEIEPAAKIEIVGSESTSSKHDSPAADDCETKLTNGTSDSKMDLDGPGATETASTVHDGVELADPAETNEPVGQDNEHLTAEISKDIKVEITENATLSESAQGISTRQDISSKACEDLAKNQKQPPDSDKEEQDTENKRKNIIDDFAQKEKTLAEFIIEMDNFTPIIPEALMDYYLSCSGFECDDVRIKRILALATQKFISDIATDAFQFNRIRMQASKDRRIGGRERKSVLTLEDLSNALSEYGINVKKPDFYL